MFDDDAETPCARETTIDPIVEAKAPEEARARPVRSFEEDSEDELGTRLYRADFERAANDARLRDKLRSERLREVIRAIDEAVDGGKALERAKADPDFREFTEEALNLLEAGRR